LIDANPGLRCLFRIPRLLRAALLAEAHIAPQEVSRPSGGFCATADDGSVLDPVKLTLCRACDRQVVVVSGRPLEVLPPNRPSSM
jgi:hypothetical protein